MFTVYAFISGRGNPEFLVEKVYFCSGKSFFSKLPLNYLSLDFLPILCTQHTQRLEEHSATHDQFYARGISSPVREPGYSGRKDDEKLLLASWQGPDNQDNHIKNNNVRIRHTELSYVAMSCFCNRSTVGVFIWEVNTSSHKGIETPACLFGIYG